jgi:hypothetical protein
MESKLQLPNYSLIPKVGCNSFAYKYHLVNGISLGLAQSDSFKWRPLYVRRLVYYTTNVKETTQNKTKQNKKTLYVLISVRLHYLFAYTRQDKTMSQTTYKQTIKNSNCFVFLLDFKLTDAKGIEWSQLS